MEIILTDNLTESLIDNLLLFISRQQQYYPNFDDWVFGKLKNRLLSGEYKSLVAIDQGSVIGNCVYDGSGQASIKNFRIDPEYRNHFLGSTLLSFLRGKSELITADITVNNFDAVRFFIRHGFIIESMSDLYIRGQSEYLISYKRKEHEI